MGTYDETEKVVEQAIEDATDAEQDIPRSESGQTEQVSGPYSEDDTSESVQISDAYIPEDEPNVIESSTENKISEEESHKVYEAADCSAEILAIPMTRYDKTEKEEIQGDVVEQTIEDATDIDQDAPRDESASMVQARMFQQE